MGSSSSKFKKYLQHGDEFAAMQVYQGSGELQRELEPNTSYGEAHHHNTPLHYAARHGMKHLIRSFLTDLGGNPGLQNSAGQTSLHLVCQVDSQKSVGARERRAHSVMLLLSWRGRAGRTSSTQERNTLFINCRDVVGNTALHYAAQSGLKQCVEFLVAHDADLFLENNEGKTACDLAVLCGHHEVALVLETHMVFSSCSSPVSEEPLACTMVEEELYSGLRTQDLQEAKDQLLVETADMLHTPLFTAEALLRENEWSRPYWTSGCQTLLIAA
jgi:ankyrin repeat/IBR domain-containing protein 1